MKHWTHWTRGAWTLLRVAGYTAEGHVFGDALVSISCDSLGRLAHLYDTEQDPGLVRMLSSDSSDSGERLAAVYLDADAVAAFGEAMTTGRLTTLFYNPTRPAETADPACPASSPAIPAVSPQLPATAAAAAGSGAGDAPYIAGAVRDEGDAEPVPLTIRVAMTMNPASPDAHAVPSEAFIEQVLEMKRTAFEIDAVLGGMSEEETEQNREELRRHQDAMRAEAAGERAAAAAAASAAALSKTSRTGRSARRDLEFEADDVSSAAIRQFWYDVAPLWSEDFPVNYGCTVNYGIAARAALDWFVLRNTAGKASVLSARRKDTLNPSLASFLAAVLLREATNGGCRLVRIEPLPVSS